MVQGVQLKAEPNHGVCINNQQLISCMKCEKLQSVQKGTKITELVFAISRFHCALKCVYISRNGNVLTAFV
jgi:hypothetical protein